MSRVAVSGGNNPTAFQATEHERANTLGVKSGVRVCSSVKVRQKAPREGRQQVEAASSRNRSRAPPAAR